MDERRQQRAERAGERVRGALHRAVRGPAAAAPTGARPAAARAASRGERPVEQLAVRVEQHGDGMPRPLDAGVVGGAEAGVGAELDHLRAGRARERGPVVATTRCRRRPAAARVGGARARRAARGSGPAESCRTTTIENITRRPPPPAPHASAARSPPSSAARSRRGPPSSSRARSARVGRDAQQRVGQTRGVARAARRARRRRAPRAGPAGR